MTNLYLIPIIWIILTLIGLMLLVRVSKRYGYTGLVAIFCSLYLVSTVLANKMISVFGFFVPAGTILFSITFLATDLISEVHGKEKARDAVWLGFLCQIVLLVGISVAIYWVAAPFWQNQEAFEATLGNTWRIILGSLVAYIISQNHDVWAFHFWKKKLDGKHLWFRNNASTIVSQLIDTVVFSVIAFAGVLPLMNIIVGTFIVKVAIALLDTPFLYLSRRLISK